MPSAALSNLKRGLEEISALQAATPTIRDGLRNPDAVRAVGRSAVVLLSSHLERFVYALFEEAVSAICQSAVPAQRLPNKLRLQHARQPVDELSLTAWERRADKLTAFAAGEALLWAEAAVINELSSERLLSWMASPDPQSLVRAFRLWAVEDIFEQITRGPTRKRALRLGLQELVDKRNNIAHGDFTAEATMRDVVRYKAVVGRFGDRADRALARAIQRITPNGTRPW
jgi:hypothetical protein